jgi:precorrin-6B methylase 2
VTNYIMKAARKAFRSALRIKAHRAVSRLHEHKLETAQKLALALEATLDGLIDPQERVWIDRIEAQRERLDSSTTEITVVIYGVTSPDLNLTAEEMYEGTTITKTVGDICRGASKPYFWAFLLLRLIREFKPAVCLELGTCLGISTAYQACALKLNKAGKVVTLEGAEPLASLARENFQQLGLDNISTVVGRFQDTLDAVLGDYGPIDFAFIDGHHDEKATLAYFEQIKTFLTEKAVLVFDDISWSDGMKRAWKAITEDHNIKVAVDMREVGICIIDHGMSEKLEIDIRLF